jgi:outer membrane protein TolC
VQTGLIVIWALLAQQTTPQISLLDALARAKRYGGQVHAAGIAAELAREDSKQARANALPAVNGLNQFVYTEGNGTASGVFVGADGVHVYNEQLQVHQDLFAIVRRGEIRRAAALEAAAKAKVDVATRGLVSTVMQDYYAVVSSARKAANAKISLDEARRFLDITDKQEKGGEAAHSDVIKAQLQVQQRERELQDGRLLNEKAKITLAVLIFPDFQQVYDVVDDSTAGLKMPELDQVPGQSVPGQSKAGNPEVRVAQANVEAAKFDVSVARYGYLPSFAVDVFYGINANQFAATSAEAQESGRSTLPNYLVANRQNLGYQAQVTLNIPLWNWGATRSKVRQAELRQDQANLELTLAQRQLQANVAAFSKEAQGALAQIQSLDDTAKLSAESLRLTVLRYQAGEATALEVVDAQSTLASARNAYEDGLLRYRVALANLQTVTGTF